MTQPEALPLQTFSYTGIIYAEGNLRVKDQVAT